jgi:hypothetical protein
MKKYLLGLGAAITVVALASPSQAATARVAGSTGVGWSLLTDQGKTWNLKHNFTYSIKFVTKDSRTKTSPYFKTAVTQLNSLPSIKAAHIKFVLTTSSTATIGGTNYAKKNWCAGKQGDIMVMVDYRPLDGQEGNSVAKVCHQSNDWSAYGGYVIMDSEYWANSKWFSKNSSTNNQHMLNGHSHELGHMLGLDHPDPANYSSKESVPVMNAPNGGYQNSSAGKYTAADIRGIDRLVAAGK